MIYNGQDCFTFDGFDFTGLLLLEEINRPLMPPVEASTIATRDGTVTSDVKLGPATIGTVVRLMDFEKAPDHFKNLAEMRRRAAGRLFRRQPCKLILPDEPDLYLNAYVKDTSELTNLNKTKQTTLNWYCDDPLGYGPLNTETSTGGEIELLVAGTWYVSPIIAIDASGPVVIRYDDREFEVTQSVTGDLFIDSRNPNYEPTGHAVFDGELNNVAYNIHNDWPLLAPGTHTFECERPFVIEWRDTWL